MDLDRESIRNAAAGFAAVSEIVVYTLCGYFAGRYLDRTFGFDTPWLTTALTAAGFIGGFYRLYRIMKRMSESK